MSSCSNTACATPYTNYDAFVGQLASVSSSVATASSVAGYSYVTGSDLLASMTNSAGFWWRRAYEQNRDLIASVENGFGGDTVSDFAYGNDADGRRERRVDSGAVTNLFGLNARSEVVSAVLGGSAYAYGYDAIGNRVWSAFNAVTNTYAANNLNQYTAITGAAPSYPAYDADGNMTRLGDWINTWDAENRLVRSEPYGLATNGAVMLEYGYNHKNLCVAKIKKRLSGRGAGYPMDPSQPGTWDAVETRRYVWDGYNIAAEIVIDEVTPSTNVTYYTWGLDLSGTLQGAGGVGGLLAETRTTATSTNTYYALGDANGNITEYVDTTGTVRGHYGYSPFGEITIQSGDMADSFTHRFSTKPFDVETGLISYQLRYYVPVLNRWINCDPIGENGGINRYGFVNNDPLDRLDMLGESFNLGVPGVVSRHQDKQACFRVGAFVTLRTWQDRSGTTSREAGTFVERLWRKVPPSTRNGTNARAFRRLLPFGEVVMAVETVKGEARTSFADRKGDPGRDLALYVARELRAIDSRTGRACGHRVGRRFQSAPAHESALARRPETDVDFTEGLG